METLIWFAAAFVCGSLPFSVWLGKLARGVDVRDYGDGNPGATNALRAAGKGVGLLALLLDVSKAAAPVGLAYFNAGLDGFEMGAVALAPVLGHAFSPFLGWHGGKALAPILGVWVGLTLYEVPLVIMGLLVVWEGLLANDGWAVMLTWTGTMLYLLLFNPNPLFIGVFLAQGVLIVWKHRSDLARRPALRPWLRRLLRLDKR